jgi:threonine dehydratase
MTWCWLNEDEIAAGIRQAYEKEGEIVEGAGAVGSARCSRAGSN